MQLIHAYLQLLNFFHNPFLFKQNLNIFFSKRMQNDQIRSQNSFTHSSVQISLSAPLHCMVPNTWEWELEASGFLRKIRIWEKKWSGSACTEIFNPPLFPSISSSGPRGYQGWWFYTQPAQPLQCKEGRRLFPPNIWNILVRKKIEKNSCRLPE